MSAFTEKSVTKMYDSTLLALRGGGWESNLPKSECVPDVDVKIVDGAPLVHILDPKKSQVSLKTFHDYAQLVFLPYKTYVATRGSNRCCLEHLYGGQPKGTNTNEQWIW